MSYLPCNIGSLTCSLPTRIFPVKVQIIFGLLNEAYLPQKTSILIQFCTCLSTNVLSFELESGHSSKFAVLTLHESKKKSLWIGSLLNYIP